MEGNPQSWNLYTYVGNSPLNSTDPLGLWKEVDCSSGNGKCWEAQKGDSIGSLAKLLNVNSNKLNKFFGNPGVEVGQVYDASGFNYSVPTSRDEGPAVVEVFLVQPPNVSEQARLGVAKLLGMLSPTPESCHCRVGVFFPGGMGPLAELEFAGGVTSSAIQAAAADSGPTIQVFTNQTRALSASRGFYVAAGENGEALANAVRTGGRISSGRVPKALIETLRTGRLLEEAKVTMNGVQGVQYYIRPEAAQYVMRFLK